MEMGQLSGWYLALNEQLESNVQKLTEMKDGEVVYFYLLVKQSLNASCAILKGLGFTIAVIRSRSTLLTSLLRTVKERPSPAVCARASSPPRLVGRCGSRHRGALGSGTSHSGSNVNYYNCGAQVPTSGSGGVKGWELCFE